MGMRMIETPSYSELAQRVRALEVERDRDREVIRWLCDQVLESRGSAHSPSTHPTTGMDSTAALVWIKMLAAAALMGAAMALSALGHPDTAAKLGRIAPL